jgi:hypothetical protein
VRSELSGDFPGDVRIKVRIKVRGLEEGIPGDWVNEEMSERIWVSFNGRVKGCQLKALRGRDERMRGVGRVVHL